MTDNALIAYDLKHTEHPRSALGVIVTALARRKDAGLKPFIVMSCDNVPDKKVHQPHSN